MSWNETEVLDSDILNAKLIGEAMIAFYFPGDGIGAPGRIIMHRNRENGMYIVHWQNRQDGGCLDGGYYHGLPAALGDFTNRVEREERYLKARPRKERGVFRTFYNKSWQ